MRTIVLVEGVTDELAFTLAARRSGRDLEAEGVSVVPINGAHAISRFLRQLAADEPLAKLAGLYDEAKRKSSERRWSGRATVQTLIAASWKGSGSSPASPTWRTN